MQDFESILSGEQTPGKDRVDKLASGESRALQRSVDMVGAELGTLAASNGNRRAKQALHIVPYVSTSHQAQEVAGDGISEFMGVQCHRAQRAA